LETHDEAHWKLKSLGENFKEQYSKLGATQYSTKQAEATSLYVMMKYRILQI